MPDCKVKHPYTSLPQLLKPPAKSHKSGGIELEFGLIKEEASLILVVVLELL